MKKQKELFQDACKNKYNNFNSDYIFKFIADNEDITFELKFSMLEIYKEILIDLLDPNNSLKELKIKEHPQNGPYVAGLVKECISEIDDMLFFLEEADKQRVTASTGLNKTSSRSHLLFTLEIIQKMPDGREKIGILNLVDLAGSEKVNKPILTLYKIHNLHLTY